MPTPRRRQMDCQSNNNRAHYDISGYVEPEIYTAHGTLDVQRGVILRGEAAPYEVSGLPIGVPLATNKNCPQSHC